MHEHKQAEWQVEVGSPQAEPDVGLAPTKLGSSSEPKANA